MKSYYQYCAMARALDVVGDRWTLLIVRELLPDPKRYSELRAGLPGVASNLLADRLRAMAAHGLVSRRGGRYELTERGRSLDDVLQALFRWGLPLMTSGQGGDAFSPDWLAGALGRMYVGATAPEPLTVEAHAGGGVASIHIGPAAATVLSQPAAAPDVTVEGPPDHVLGVLSGLLSSGEADVVATGSRTALRRAVAARRGGTDR